jgi:hypothetical protein
VNAPCVIAQAKELAAHEQQRRAAGDYPSALKFFGRSYIGAEPPAMWHAALMTLNQKPVEFDWLEAISDLVSAEDDPHVDKRAAQARQMIREARAELLEHGRHRRGSADLSRDDRFLAPVATDPLRESRNHFIERAKDHWDARAWLAERRYGAAPVAPVPKLRKHVDWAVRHIIGGEKISTIARTERLTPQTVSEAIVRFRRLVRWTFHTR